MYITRQSFSLPRVAAFVPLLFLAVGAGGCSPPSPDELIVTPSSLRITADRPTRLEAVLIRSSRTVRPGPEVEWSSDNTAVATVAPQPYSAALVTGHAPGTVTITARDAVANLTATATVTIVGAGVSSLAITPPNPSLALGTRRQLTATATYSDNTAGDFTSRVTWTSSDLSVAAVANSGTRGELTAVSPGTATLTASFNGIQTTTTATVTPAVLVSLDVTPAAPSLVAGVFRQMTATGTFSDTTTQNLTPAVTWSTGDATVAIVANSGNRGRVTGRRAGQTTVIATMGGVSGQTDLIVTPAELVSIAITPPNSSLPRGRSQQLTATATFTDDTTQDVTTQVLWAATPSATLSVSNTSGSEGQVNAVNVGAATVMATLNGITGRTQVTVTPAVLMSLGITPANPSVARGLTQQFTATGTFSDNTTQNLTTQVTWASGTANVAIISNATGSNGLVNAANVGTSMISATLNSITGQTTLTVTPAVLVSIAVTPANPSVAAGRTQQFTAMGTFSDATTQNLTTQVTWASSDMTVATISNAAGSNGLATSAIIGTTTISATLTGVTGQTTLMVTPAVLVSIDVTPANPSVAAGRTQQFTAMGTFSDATIQDLTTQATWASSDMIVATVSNAAGSNGLATSATIGTTTISATLTGVTGQTTLTVTPAVLVSIAVTPATPSVVEGGTQPFTATGTFSDSAIQDLTTQVTWASSTMLAATISNAVGSQGLATATAAGATTISATLDGITGSTQLTVTRPTNVCGNGVIEGLEVCDDSNTVAGDGCRADCLGREICGDGQVDRLRGEQCDDRNTVDGDGCSATCQLDPFVARTPQLISGAFDCDVANSSRGRKAAVDQFGGFYVVMNCGGTAYVSSSVDRGATWVGPISTGITNVAEVAVEGGPAGVAFVAVQATDGSLIFSRTIDAGTTWATPSVLGTGLITTLPQLAMDSLGNAVYISIVGPDGANPRIYSNFTLGEGAFVFTDVVQGTTFLDLLVDHISGNIISVSDTPYFYIRISSDRAATFGAEANPPGMAFFSDWAGSNGFIYATGAFTTEITVIPVSAPATSTQAGGLVDGAVRAIDADALGNAYVATELSFGGIQLDRLVLGAPAVVAADVNSVAGAGTSPAVAALPSNSGALVAYGDGTSVYGAVVVYP